MTDERKREIADEIIAAFKRTSLTPWPGAYLSTLGGKQCACAIGVIGYEDGKAWLPRSAFRERFDVSDDHVSGVHWGFDGDFLSDNVNVAQRNGYDIGRMVREAVFK